MGKNKNDAKALTEALPKLKKDCPQELAEAMLAAWLDEQRNCARDDESEPEPIKIRKSIEALGVAATKLAAALENLPERARWQIAIELDASRMTGAKYARPVAAPMYPSQGSAFLRQIKADLGCIAEESAKARQARLIPMSTNRKGRLGEAIVELAEIFEFLTGQRPSRKVHDWHHTNFGKEYGDFYEFVCKAFKILNGNTRGISEGLKRWAAQRRRAGLTNSRWVEAFFDVNPQWGNFVVSK